MTGQCECKPGYEGVTCDRCKAEYWGSPNNGGCKACNCKIVGSENGQCHKKTGQCECKAGVSGQTCEICKYGKLIR